MEAGLRIFILLSTIGILMVITTAVFFGVVTWEKQPDVTVLCLPEHQIVYVEVENLSVLYIDEDTYYRFCR